MKPADVGGRQCFGPVTPEADEPMFHEPWEREAFALTLAMGGTGLWTLDRSRFMRETLPPAQYYGSTYYAIWLAALERLCADAGVPQTPAPRVLTAEKVRPLLAAGGPTSREGPAPRFSLGDAVEVTRDAPQTHTRVPHYVRGRIGTIVAQHGCHVFPDTNAHGKGENPVPLYTVSFAAGDLWGKDTTASEVRLDLFEPYLSAA